MTPKSCSVHWLMCYKLHTVLLALFLHSMLIIRECLGAIVGGAIVYGVGFRTMAAVRFMHGCVSSEGWAPHSKEALGGEWCRPFCSRPRVGSSKGPKPMVMRGPERVATPLKTSAF